MSAKTKCLDDLRDRILRLDITPGADLDETVLSREYGISRTPLREILQRLAGEGYIQLSEHRGAAVSAMDISRLRVFFQTAPLVYANIARQACENHKAAQLEQIKTLQTRFKKAALSKDAARAAMLNHAFHRLIGEMAHNVYLEAALGRMLIDHTRLSQTFYRPNTDTEGKLVSTACDQHDAMIAAFAQRDSDRAVDLTLAHWDLSRNSMERFVQPTALPVTLAQTKEVSHAV